MPLLRLRYACEWHSVRQLARREARYHITVRFRLRVSSKSGKTLLACIDVRQFMTGSCFERDR